MIHVKNITGKCLAKFSINFIWDENLNYISKLLNLNAIKRYKNNINYFCIHGTHTTMYIITEILHQQILYTKTNIIFNPIRNNLCLIL